MPEIKRLFEKLEKIQRLFDRATSPGERAAAQAALDRLKQQLEEIPGMEFHEEATSHSPSEPLVEFRFTLNNQWSRNLLLALMNKYGLSAFRRPGQRRTTLRVRATDSFVRETLWPEFCALDRELTGYLSEMADEIISKAIMRPSPGHHRRG